MRPAAAAMPRRGRKWAISSPAAHRPRFGEVIPSYKPGVTMTDLSRCLPDSRSRRMREALPVFGRQIARYDHPDAVMTGVETRTSSPVRITRGKDFQSLNTERPVPGGRRRGLCGRHPLRRRSTASRWRRRWHASI
jgi:uncharacterized FAD-dependent dehydrogenase